MFFYPITFRSGKCAWVFMLSISILLLEGRVEGKLSLESNIGIWLLGEGNGEVVKGTMRNKASVIMWIQFTDLGGQQNYFRSGIRKQSATAL